MTEIEALTTTADGMPIFPGDTVWVLFQWRAVPVVVASVGLSVDLVQPCEWGSGTLSPERWFYSTREAAEKARKEYGIMPLTEHGGETATEGGRVPCRDCGAPDADMPLDTVLTLEQWNAICPEDGMLCASCIVRRASKLPRVINVCLRVQFLEDYDAEPRPGGRFFQIMKALDSEGSHQKCAELST